MANPIPFKGFFSADANTGQTIPLFNMDGSSFTLPSGSRIALTDVAVNSFQEDAFVRVFADADGDGTPSGDHDEMLWATRLSAENPHDHHAFRVPAEGEADAVLKVISSGADGFTTVFVTGWAVPSTFVFDFRNYYSITP